VSDELRHVMEGRGLEGLKKTMKPLSDRSEYLPNKSQKCYIETICSFTKESHEVGVPYSQIFFETFVQKMMGTHSVKSAAI
jgi:hypothetical protein